MTNQTEELSKQPLISLVIPTFNQGRFIRTCLQSILNQSLSNVEIIVQDNLSNDDTQEIVQTLAKQHPNIRYFRERDSGQSDAINRGLYRSHGVFWNWLCSDDFLIDQNSLLKLSSQLQEILTRNPSCVGVFGRARYISEEGQAGRPYRGELNRDVIQGDFQYRWPFAQPASLLVRKRVLEVGGVDPDLHLGMDLDLFIKMLGEGHTFSACDVEVAGVRLHNSSKSIKLRSDSAIQSLSIVQKHFGSVGNVGESVYARSFAASWMEKRFRIVNFVGRITRRFLSQGVS